MNEILNRMMEEGHSESLAQRQSTQDFFELGGSRTFLSKLHEKAAPWTPEKGSLEYKRGMHDKRNNKDARFHWNGSDCTHAGFASVGIDARSRILDGYSFDRLPTSERCIYCEKQFQNA